MKNSIAFLMLLSFAMAAQLAALGATTQPSTQPAITQLQNTILAGEGCEVNALNSTLNSTLAAGNWLTADFKWDFGDPLGQFNTLPGWNAGHVYTAPGTYTITLTLTDAAGATNTARTPIQVNADLRTAIYVDPQGSDLNTGLTPQQAYQTVAKAAAAMGANTKVLFKRGEVFTVFNTLWLTSHDQAIGAYGDGAKPVLWFSPLFGDMAIFFVGSQAANITIADVTFDSSNGVTTGPANDLPIYAVWAGGSNLVVSGCEFRNVGDAVNGTQHPSGVIVQNCTAPLLKGMRGYLCWAAGNNWSILGNTVANTTRAHCVRANDPDESKAVLVYGNNLTKQYPSDDPLESTKDTVDVRLASFVFVSNNVLCESPCGLSPSPGQTASQRVTWCRFTRNWIHNGQLTVDEVSDHARIDNNVLDITGTGQIAVIPTGPTVPGATITDVTIDHNTGINSGLDGQFINVNGKPAPASIAITSNLYIAPQSRFGYGWDSAVWINAPDLTGFSQITGNIWPTPNTFLPGAVNWLAGTSATPTNTQAGYLTMSQWNQLLTGTDLFSPVVLPAAGTYQATICGVTAGATNVPPLVIIPPTPTTQPSTQPTTQPTTQP